jgi:hypothetical protein
MRVPNPAKEGSAVRAVGCLERLAAALVEVLAAPVAAVGILLVVADEEVVPAVDFEPVELVLEAPMEEPEDDVFLLELEFELVLLLVEVPELLLEVVVLVEVVVVLLVELGEVDEDEEDEDVEDLALMVRVPVL